MFNLRKLAAAAVMTLSAASAMASNFRAADQVYLPVGGHIQGASALFVTDLVVSNLTTDNVTVTMIFASSDQGTQNTNIPSIALLPNERKELIDFFGTANLSGLGQVIFNACKTGTDCGPATQDASGVSPNFRNISVEARVYSVPVGSNLSTAPTNGQDIAGMPWYTYASLDQQANDLHRVFITGIRNTGSGAGTYRTNLFVANASQYSETDLVITIYDSKGNVLGTKPQHLKALGQVQIAVAGITGVPSGSTATGLWASVEQVGASATTDSPASCGTNGCPAFFAVGSVLDNVTSDATTLEPQFFKSLDYALTAIFPGSSAGKTNMKRVVRH